VILIGNVDGTGIVLRGENDRQHRH
jgi:hypothetical protein